jgi:hypothetical protein
MSGTTELIRELDQQKFVDMVKDTPKEVRENIFTRLDIKKPSTSPSKFAKPGAKNEERIRGLYTVLQDETDDEVSDELLRNYFLKRRTLLADALDFLGVAHDNGLTSTDIDQFEKLSKDKASSLLKKLCEKHDRADVLLYLRFMKVPHLPG